MLNGFLNIVKVLLEIYEYILPSSRDICDDHSSEKFTVDASFNDFVL